MIPEFELDDVGQARQRRNFIDMAGGDDARAASLDHVGVTAVAGCFEQNESLNDILRQRALNRRVRLADPAAEMRRDVENLHPAAAAGTSRLVPPGATTSGLMGTSVLNFASSNGR